MYRIYVKDIHMIICRCTNVPHVIHYSPLFTAACQILRMHGILIQAIVLVCTALAAAFNTSNLRIAIQRSRHVGALYILDIFRSSDMMVAGMGANDLDQFLSLDGRYNNIEFGFRVPIRR